jgi:hypothetical protein
MRELWMFRAVGQWAGPWLVFFAIALFFGWPWLVLRGTGAWVVEGIWLLVWIGPLIVAVARHRRRTTRRPRAQHPARQPRQPREISVKRTAWTAGLVLLTIVGIGLTKGVALLPVLVVTAVVLVVRRLQARTEAASVKPRPARPVSRRISLPANSTQAWRDLAAAFRIRRSKAQRSPAPGTALRDVPRERTRLVAARPVLSRRRRGRVRPEPPR